MPLLDITKPEVIKYLTESYNKTALLRSRWNRLHKERLAEAATFTHEKGYRELDVAAVSMRGGLAATTRDYASGAVNRRRVSQSEYHNLVGISALKKGHSIVDLGLGDPTDDPRLARRDTDLQVDPKMRPVDPEQTEILYKGIPIFGRKVYLKRREQILPEDRFYFPETSACEYGWRLKDSYFGRPGVAKFRRVSRF